MFKSLRPAVLAIFLLAAATAFAHEEPAEEGYTGPWSGEFALGYLASDGNTDTSSLTGRVKLGYATGNWEHFGEFKGYGSSDENGTSAEAYEALGKSLYNINERNYLFGQLQWKKNRFSAYTKQVFETVGYGRRILNDDRFELNAEVGAGFSQSDKVITEDPRTTEDEDNAVFTLGGNFLWKISDVSSFEQLVSARSTSDNTNWETITRVKANIVGGVALVAAYNIQGNTDTEAGTEKTDRYTSVTLEYSF